MYALRGQVIEVQNIGSLAGVTIEASAIVRSRGGSTQSLTIETLTAQSDRALSVPVPSDERTRSEGVVVAASIRVVAGSPVRGELFCILSVRGGPELCRGYLTRGNGVNLGEYEDSLSGRGFLRWVEVFHDAAGDAAEVRPLLAATNTLRKIYGLVHYYHASGTVATRLVNSPYLANLGPAKPTGFTTTGTFAHHWIPQNPVNTITANQESAWISTAVSGDQLTSRLDTGARVVDVVSGNPTPWPLWVEQNDLALIAWRAHGSAENDDTQSGYILMEEWFDI